MRCVDRVGPQRFTLADVAAELGVIRQTVYRYYASTDELFVAVGEHELAGFANDITARVSRITEPSAWVVEALAWTYEQLHVRPYLTLLLAAGRSERFSRGVTSKEAIDVGHDILKRSRVDWAAAGYDSRDIDELIELMLRILQSLVIDPPNPPRTGRELRRCLRGWIGPH